MDSVARTARPAQTHNSNNDPADGSQKPLATVLSILTLLFPKIPGFTLYAYLTVLVVYRMYLPFNKP